MQLAEIDLSDQAFWAQPWEVKLEAMATLREQAPFALFVEPEIFPGQPPGPGYHAITRHADVVAMSRKPDLFCSGQSAVSLVDLPEEMNELYGSLINMDDPRHAQIRRVVSRAFTPKMLAKVTDDIVAVARDLVAGVAADLAADPGGAVDLVSQLSSPFPLTIIMRMMGIPTDRYDEVLRATNIILSGGDPEFVPEDVNPILAFLEAGQSLRAIMLELAAEREAHPTDDVTSTLLSGSVDGERLTPEELASFFILLVVAGNETTRTATSHGVLALARYPEQRRIWAADVEGVTPTAVEEIVRWCSPVQWMRRTVTRDATYEGHEFREGEKVALYYGAANRDPAVFEQPDTFDVRRSPNPHVGFGGPGPHFCLGANLARRELAVVFGELFRQLPALEIVGEPEMLVSSFINGIKRMPVRQA
jgi:cytochrome P450